MQQTEKYKLNLIERSDPFSPDGLNENTRKIEDAMIAHETAVAGELETRITKFTYGSAVRGSADNITIHLPFKPKAVIVHGSPEASLGQHQFVGTVIGQNIHQGSYSFTMTEDGFVLTWGSSCNYIAFG